MVDFVTLVDLKAYAAGVYLEGLTLLTLIACALVAFRGKLHVWRDHP